MDTLGGSLQEVLEWIRDQDVSEEVITQVVLKMSEIYKKGYDCGITSSSELTELRSRYNMLLKRFYELELHHTQVCGCDCLTQSEEE